MPHSVDIVIPTLNEAHALPRSLPIVHSFLIEHLSEYRWNLLVADNGSTDGTADVARDISTQLPAISVIELTRAGRGHALSTAWLQSDADFLSYMDVDLSSELSVLPELLKQLVSGWDIAVGSRHLSTSQVRRSLRRSILSQGYNFTARKVLGMRFSDAQCGIKAITAPAARDLLPRVRNGGWFFDTELLALAQTLGYRIAELPVRWTEDPDSRVRLLPTVLEDLAGLGRLRLRDLPAARSAQRNKALRPDALIGDSG